MSSYSAQHLAETVDIVQRLEPKTLEKMVDLLSEVRQRGGRLFFLGVGGSAANEILDGSVTTPVFDRADLAAKL